MYDVVVLTDDQSTASQKNNFVDNAMREDQPVLSALEKRGLRTKRVAWSDPAFDWSSTRFALVRTIWDYHERFEAFKTWLNEVSKKTGLINPFEQITWNLDKHYLGELGERGLNVVETCFIEPGDTRSLADIHRELGWSHTVLKPVISASAKDTYKLSSSDLSAHEGTFRKLVENKSMMLQPFQERIPSDGELSLIVIGGEFTHAVLKKAKPGDFRVQNDFGGTSRLYSPTKEEIDFAVSIVHTCDPVPVYARVDVIRDNNGDLALIELELIEPELWFRYNESAAEKLAQAVSELL